MIEIVKIIIAILIMLYVLWFISTHSELVTLTDLITVWGGSLVVFGIFLQIIVGRIHKQYDSLERTINHDIIPPLNQLIGKLNSTLQGSQQIPQVVISPTMTQTQKQQQSSIRKGKKRKK